MGYCMTQRGAEFRIKKENFAAALAAVKALADKPEQMGGGSSTGERWYSWVDTNGFVNAKTLADAIGAWRWEVDCSAETGDVFGITFCGEKLGDDMIFFEALAPFVEAGSFIDMEGEDGCLWRWAFDGKTLKEVAGRVVFES